jgi:TolB protein
MMTRQQRRAAARRGVRPAGRGARFWIGAGVVVGLLAWIWWSWTRPGRTEAVRDGAPNWSPDSRRVLFYSERGGKADLFIADRSGANRRQLTNTPADEGAPAMSPDGQWIAFDTDRDRNFEIYVMRTDGTGWRRLTTHPARDVAPAWSPDGRHIVFMSARDNPEFDVHRMDADGANVTPLTRGSSNWFPQYSPDGARLALHVMRDVHVLDVGTGATQRLTEDPLNGMHPTWSPDGRRIAFMSWRNGRTEIFTANADGSNQQPLVSMPHGDAVDPRWSPDGQFIAFVHVPSGGVTGAQDAAQERIVYVYEIATKAMTRVSR